MRRNATLPAVVCGLALLAGVSSAATPAEVTDIGGTNYLPVVHRELSRATNSIRFMASPLSNGPGNLPR